MDLSYGTILFTGDLIIISHVLYFPMLIQSLFYPIQSVEGWKHGTSRFSFGASNIVYNSSYVFVPIKKKNADEYKKSKYIELYENKVS